MSIYSRATHGWEKINGHLHYLVFNQRDRFWRVYCRFIGNLFRCRFILDELEVDRNSARLSDALTTKRLGTYLIFDAAVSTFKASCSSATNRFFKDLACPLVKAISSSLVYCAPWPLTSSEAVLNFLQRWMRHFFLSEIRRRTSLTSGSYLSFAVVGWFVSMFFSR